MSENAFKNRLIHEKSPYLLQHAANPIDWYPWGDEAFAKARAEDKPIFLSIGYSSCHWCHVMEKESFANPQLAGLMNDVFINIKVDREEHPEVDSLYMELAQALLSGGGGWPLNLVLTPDLKPFFACTYLPPSTARGVLGLKEFTEQVSQLWKSEEKTLLIDQADKIVDVLANLNFPTSSDLPGGSEFKHFVEELFDQFDPVLGGIKSNQKFPMAYLYEFLFAFARKYQDSRALFLAELSLDKMFQGGIYDHLGGGFSRYCVDEAWHFPHFEKMLGCNAFLFLAYLEGFCCSHKPRYLEVCQKTLGYLLNTLKAPQGGFFIAQDADSQGKEGYYYTWDFEEIKQHLPKEIFSIFVGYYNLSKKGNFEGRNVLFTHTSMEEFAQTLDKTVEETKAILEKGRQILLGLRNQRTSPSIDQKIILSWNGLMIEVLAKAGFFIDLSYLKLAEETASFLKTQFIQEGKLFRRFCDQEVRFAATLDDYAFLIKGLISLFEMGGRSEWLEWAVHLCDYLEEHFKNEEGIFYFTEVEPNLVLRRPELIDGSEPSGNAVHAENLLRLYQIVGDERFIARAKDILRAASSLMDKYPAGAGYHLKALLRYLDTKALTVVIALDSALTGLKEIQLALKACNKPHLSIIWKYPEDKKILQIIPSLVDKTAVDGQTAIYICRQDGCLSPILDTAKLSEIIQSL